MRILVLRVLRIFWHSAWYSWETNDQSGSAPC